MDKSTASNDTMTSKFYSGNSNTFDCQAYKTYSDRHD